MRPKTLMIVGCLAALSAPAFAQELPVVVVVESSARQVSAGQVREGLREVGLTPLSMASPQAASVRDTLTVAVDGDGRAATVHLRTPRGVEVRFLRAREARAPLRTWLAAPIAALVRANRAVRNVPQEVADPWENVAPRTARPHRSVPSVEVLDPWSSQHPASASTGAINVEVLDPWRDAPRANTPAPPVERVDSPAVVDPWSSETGDGLTRPRPAS
ncbi:MAG: hypothetical protein AAGE52_23640 [Myxococcota bacterium]